MGADIIAGDIEAALPSRGNTRYPAEGDKRQRHNSAIAPKRLGTIIGDIVELGVIGLIAIVNMVGKVIVDSPGAIDGPLDAVDQPRCESAQKRREPNVGA